MTDLQQCGAETYPVGPDGSWTRFVCSLPAGHGPDEHSCGHRGYDPDDADSDFEWTW